MNPKDKKEHVKEQVNPLVNQEGTSSKKNKSKDMPIKQKLFVYEYLISRNGTDAAIKAGYSKKTAAQIAARLLRNVKIQNCIDNQVKKIEEKSLIDAAFVLQGLKDVSERCLQRKPVMVFDYINKELVQKTEEVPDPDNPGKTKEEGVWEFDSTGANKAFELLGKHLKLFTDKIQIGPDVDLARIMEEARQRVLNDRRNR